MTERQAPSVAARSDFPADAGVAAEFIDQLLDTYLARGGAFPFREQLKQEALFGFSEIFPEMGVNHRLLEIGAGTGLLSGLIAASGAKIDALEPLGLGFSSFSGLLTSVVQASGGRINLIDSEIEKFDVENEYDLIFSINVFEHVSDWRQAIRRTHAALKRGGKAVILCPSYNFPYEPHFGIPIIRSKGLTYRLFERQITHHETSRDGAGLWDSLNFIKASELAAFCEKEDIQLSFDKSIISRMLSRAVTDPEFSKRRGRLAPFIRASNRWGLGALLSCAPIRTQPYLRFVLSK